MKRAVIYARYSSDRQNDKSCDDQIQICKSWAERQGFNVTATYKDEAVSGASVINRPELEELMIEAQKGQFDTVICEALDRLSRDQADLAQLKKQLNFLGISIHTVQDGEVGTIHVGIKGLMGELYLADLAQKTKRGLTAVVNDGRSAGGKSYGYDVVPGKPGELTINQDEAEVVRRIYSEYADSKTPRQIAAGLNADGIPSPRGGKWNASTINGSKQRQNGILQNLLYDGKTVWNRQRFIKNPETGKRVSRPNPREEWIINDAPEMRIVNPEIFAKAAEIKAQKSVVPSQKSQKPRYVLSGLLKCGCCGASYTVVGNARLGCSGFRERGDCTNNRTVARAHIEQRVLDALQQQLAQPEYIAEYVKAYYEERKRLEGSQRSQVSAKKKELNRLTKEIDRCVNMMIKGLMSDSMIPKVNEMEVQKKQIASELESLEQKTQPIKLHPSLASKYKRAVENLQKHLNDIDEQKEKEKLFEEIRRLVEKVVITPTESKKPVELEVHGQLADLLSISQGNQYRGVVVAGARNNHYPTLRFTA